MYVALRELKTNLGIVKTGEVVHDALNWRYSIILAHVNMNFMRWVEDGNPLPPNPEKKTSPVKALPKEPPKSKSEAKRIAVSTEVKIAAGIVKCEKCPTKEFKSPRALKIHVTAAHGK